MTWIDQPVVIANTHHKKIKPGLGSEFPSLAFPFYFKVSFRYSNSQIALEKVRVLASNIDCMFN